MKKKTHNKIRLQKATLILMAVILGFVPTYLSNYDYSNNQIENLIEDTIFDNENYNYGSLKTSVLGNHSWWDSNFAYRRLITVTNPYNFSFTDFGVSLTFNYAELGTKIQSDLDDVRIVENGVLRNYYIIKDYPSTDYATVWFDTNILNNQTERDTYLYFGNPSAANAESIDPSDSFGWIKNGDFELDINTSQNFEPYGWYFSHNPVDTIKGQNNPSPLESDSSASSRESFVNKLIDDPEQAERIGHGDYAYKFGTSGRKLHTDTINDYAGTLFSYPFKVPIVDGEISLNVYRNIRTYRFEKPKNMDADLNVDGYFIRVLNGSDLYYSTDPDQHDDNDINHNNYDNYGEVFDGYSEYNPSSKKWLPLEDQTKLIDYDTHTSGNIIKNTLSDTSSDGELTGAIEINLTRYMGEVIFFELGVWGDESNAQFQTKSAFFQVDDIRFNYTLTTSIEELQGYKSDVTIVAKDVDGRIVPNVEIFIVNDSARGTPGFIVDSKVATDGSITFIDLPRGRYNITANYTVGSQELVVFNSSLLGIGSYYFNGINYTVEIQLNLWTIDFEIEDWDGLPLKYGYIEVNESIGTNFVKKITLDENGKATFRGLNRSSYYYKVYYDNDDYVDDFSPVALNESYINRSDYVKNNVKFRNHTIYLNNTSVGSYSINERFYTDGSRSEIGNKKIINANIELSNMNDYLEDISVYYIDKDDSIVGNLIYYKEYATTDITDDFIEIDISLLDNENLKNDNYEVYGIQIEVNGFNSTKSNGIIDVNLVETCNVNTRTPVARLNIRLVYYSDIDKEYKPLSGTIKVVDNLTKLPLVNLSSFSGRDGYAYAPKNSYETPFWYLRGRKYNFTIDIANNTNVEFNITDINPPQWIPAPGEKINEYNYTLYQNSSITFNIIPDVGVNFTNYDSSFNRSYSITDILWGETMNLWVEFLSTNDNWDTWQYVSDPPASCLLTIKLAGTEVILKTFEMNYVGFGNYTSTFNSGLLSAGNDKRYYDFQISGFHPTYDDPTPIVYLVKVNAIPTTISAHDYSSQAILPSKLYSAYYNELVNITIQYSIEGSGYPLINAELSYEWLGLSSVSIFADPINFGFFTFAINTSDGQSTGLKVISITASYENYTTISDFLVYLNIFERKTTLNDQTADLVYLSSKIWIEDPKYFIFTYRDESTNVLLGDLPIASYVWEELYANGTKVPSSQGSGSLLQNANNTYTLDFRTGIKPLGYYFIYVTLKQDNYVQKNAFINIEIMPREFTVLFNEPQLGSNNQISIAQGTDIDFEVSLWDETRDVELVNATVNVNFRGFNYEFDPDPAEDGTYIFKLETSNIDTFIIAKTFIAKITLEAANFTKQEISITITVKMEEIFSGMPTFYFILITASIIGVGGSLVAYRVIQQARIPKHVKKIRKIKSLIKSKKKITEIPSIPTKEQMIAKIFGNDWKEIDLSIDEVLGIQAIKTKKLPKKEKTPKEPTIEKLIEEKVKKEKELKKRLKKEEIKIEKPPVEQKFEEELPEEILEEQELEEELPEEEVLEEQELEEEPPEEEILEEQEFEEET
ncbi:MAG: hypothetical protein ACFFDY_05810, partial [Candidatus Thorarchaeota archaeon]